MPAGVLATSATAITVLADGQSMAVERERGGHASCIIHSHHTTARTAARSTPTAEARTGSRSGLQCHLYAMIVVGRARAATVNAGRGAGDFTAAVAALADGQSMAVERERGGHAACIIHADHTSSHRCTPPPRSNR